MEMRKMGKMKRESKWKLDKKKSGKQPLSENGVKPFSTFSLSFLMSFCLKLIRNVKKKKKKE